MSGISKKLASTRPKYPCAKCETYRRCIPTPLLALARPVDVEAMLGLSLVLTLCASLPHRVCTSRQPVRPIWNFARGKMESRSLSLDWIHLTSFARAACQQEFAKEAAHVTCQMHVLCSSEKLPRKPPNSMRCDSVWPFPCNNFDINFRQNFGGVASRQSSGVFILQAGSRIWF